MWSHIRSIQEVIHGTKGSAWWVLVWNMFAVGSTCSANGVQQQEIRSTVLSGVDGVHSGGFFPFLHEERVFPTTLRGAGVALRVNKIGFACI
jgi:hypothetical protein